MLSFWHILGFHGGWFMVSVWVNSGSWWWTGRLGMLQFMGLQRVGHNWVTELNWWICYLGQKLDHYSFLQWKQKIIYKFLLSRYKLLGRLGYGLSISYKIINSLIIELFSAVNNDKIVERICVATVAFMLHYLSIQCPHVAAAAAAAKSLQSCPTLVRPHRQQPTRLRHPWDSLGKITGVGCHFFLQPSC